MIDWPDEALDRAISQLKALRFNTEGMTARQQMKIVLDAAMYAAFDGATEKDREILNLYSIALRSKAIKEQRAKKEQLQ